MNSPDFILAWLGLWSIGAAPAMINYNLASKALLHCLKISGTKLLLVDPHQDLRTRIDEVKSELAMRIVLLDAEQKSKISEILAVRPADCLRDVVRGDWPMCLFYTRQVIHVK